MILHVYTDGGLKPMPDMPKGTGLGGTGVVVVHPAKGILAESAGHFPKQTTNQRMEMLSVLNGINLVRQLEGEDLIPAQTTIRVHSDSAYTVNGMNDEWWNNWIIKQAGGWKTSERKPVENQDLWRAILSQTPALHNRLVKSFGPGTPWRRLANMDDQSTGRASLAVHRTVEFIKVKGHSADVYNKRADELATLGKNNQPVDVVFYDLIKSL